MKDFQFELEEKYFKYDPQPLLKYVLSNVFKTQNGLVQSIMRDGQSPQHCFHKLDHLLTKEKDMDMKSTQFFGHALKNIDYDGSEWTLIRSYHGDLKLGMSIKVIDSELSEIAGGEENDLEESEYASSVITEIALLGGRYLYPVQEAHKGQLVLVKGISEASFYKISYLIWCR